MMNDKLNKLKSALKERDPRYLALCQLGIFVLWLNVLVFLKWDSNIGVPDDIVITPWYELQDYSDKYDQLGRLNTEHEKALVKLQSLQNRFHAVSKNIDKILDEYEDNSLWNQQKLLFIQATDASFHTPSKLRQLLEKENLEDAYPLENSLRPAFREAAADLQQNMERGMGNIDWKGLQSEFRSFAIPVRPLVEVLPRSCDTAEDGETDDTSPTEDDMNEKIQIIRDLAARRWQVLQSRGRTAWQLPFSFEKTIERQMAKRELMLTELEASRLEIAKERSALKSDTNMEEGNMEQCIKSQDVLPWLEDGLQAFFRGRDPRQAVLRKVIEAHPSVDASEALIELPSSSDISRQERAAPKNLRQLLDSPLIMESGRSINMIVDSMGGYSDWFDQYIDGLGVDDVGKVVINALMQRAGRINLPPIPEFINKYRKQSTFR
ncbi:hypothetical protein FisN_25Hh145 [Fistulifera solaris]|jgi:hypothetical protein|uniref:Uncharacterized protein n=1 Tax=Fistulifera solaris TaxID=1519565 RepID=A0A1Z5JWE4_FISSO|nr:hypothetical protein FisN_25Hh145 [Fistulifera solaris]|eukprot:GAX18162.1 hypothetical protein FisN_25Hh145 [Fistulifera solaris]